MWPVQKRERERVRERERDENASYSVYRVSNMVYTHRHQTMNELNVLIYSPEENKKYFFNNFSCGARRSVQELDPVQCDYME